MIMTRIMGWTSLGQYQGLVRNRPELVQELLCRNIYLNQLCKIELQNICIYYRLQQSGNKPDLRKRITEYFQNESESDDDEEDEDDSEEEDDEDDEDETDESSYEESPTNEYHSIVRGMTSIKVSGSNNAVNFGEGPSKANPKPEQSLEKKYPSLDSVASILGIESLVGLEGVTTLEIMKSNFATLNEKYGITKKEFMALKKFQNNPVT
ncbi:hypothetical protein HK103_002413 [Boothiomyces macroporosus]|uniref:SAP domain-containing protein n=1 Tax=Boothiomyces macroporosus TaxID=261099 RepID=A0AAD5UAA3_9FUNG|nr:hypothetical protein HK103_002413 [Boothiomyces macroporosus]